MQDINRLMRRETRQLQPFVPQLPDLTIPALQQATGCEEIIKLSFNENPYGPSPKAVAAIQAAATKVNLYHDCQGKGLKAVLAAEYKVEPENVFLSNGADEAVLLLGEAFLEEGDEAVMLEPSFGQYAFTAVYRGAKAVKVPLKADLTIDFTALLHSINSRTKLVFICNPNNPTGIAAGRRELSDFLLAVPDDVVVVLDEAYSEFAAGADFLSGLELLAERPNIVVVRTFSKVYGLAALRIGYGLASAGIVRAIDSVRCIYNVNMLAEEAAKAAVSDVEYREQVIRRNAEQREKVAEQLASYGFRVYPSQTNFIFVNIGQAAEPVCQTAAREGVIIRSGKQWGHPTCLRISLGTAAQNEKLLNLLHKKP